MQLYTIMALMIGIDIIKIERMAKLMEKYPKKSLQKFLTPSEIALVSSPKTAAGFWAAKEAASKALGVGISAECGFMDIILSKTPRGAPQITFSQRVKKYFKLADASVSITHDGDYAIAVVTVEK